MAEHHDRQERLTVLSWNVNGFNRKRSEVLHQLSLLKADVVFLQETHVGPDGVYSTGSIKIQTLEGDYAMSAFTVFKGSSRGVAVLFKKNLEFGGFRVEGDNKGRYIIISCQIWGHDFVFLNVYNSNDEKIKFTDLCDKISPSAYLVIGGDFNTVMDADLDRTSNLRNRSHRKSFDALRRFLEMFNLVDVWRCIYPEVKSFTYFDGKGQSRLDYFFIQSHNLARVTACSIHERPQYLDKEDYISDHTPLSIQIQTSEPKWKLDAFLLQDKACMERLSCIIKTISEIKTERKGELWPGVKIRLLCEAITFQKGPKCLERSRCSDRTPTFEFPQEMEHMKQEDSEPYNEVLHSENVSCTPHSLHNFLDQLHQTERFEDLKSTLNTVLTEPISRKEILVAILSLPESECLTPGELTVNFYKHYASKITDLLQAFFNHILNFKSTNGTFLESLSQSDYDHTYSHHIQYNCSPFTLMNVDYNILATVLAERLDGVIKHILNPGESKPHTSVQDIICALQEEPSDQSQKLIVSLKVKAERLKWPYLFYSLKLANLPNRFISVLKLLLTEGDIKSSSLCSPLQGLKVGCPLTPLLISICLLPLIDSVEKRLGPTVPQSVTDKDKAIVLLSSTNEALDSFEKMLQEFTETSGLLIDERHSEVFLTGPSRFMLENDRLKLFKRTDNAF